MKNNETCFENHEFARFLEDRSEMGEETRILAHIGNCDKCRAKLEQLAGHEEIWSELQEHLAEHDLDTPTQTLTRQQRELATVRNLIAPSEKPEMLGRLGSYEICGIIGRGSAGIVVKALDTRLNRFVAIKLLAPAYSNHGCSRRRFERECKAIASVKNQNVVEIHTVEEFNGTPYIVMPYVPSGSLQKRIERHGPLNTNEVVCVGMQIANGLAAAHQRGIVHRDVKPANVLLENGIEGAKVSDFGLARVVDEATMTHSGTISGTPQYMSPEQAKGERVDQRSDLFSLGSTLYMTCTGHAPFTSESVFGIIKKVCDSDPRPIQEFNPDIPKWLVAFIEKLHAKDPDDRFASARLASDLLAAELAHLQSPTLAPEPVRTWWQQPRTELPCPVPAPPVKATKTRTRSFSAWLVTTAILFTALFSGLIGSQFFGHNGETPITFTEGGHGPATPEMLIMLRQENEKLPRFHGHVESAIDVQPGGQLWFDSNLGAVQIETHDENQVIVTARHSVAARNQEEADELLNAVKFSYKPDEANELHDDFQKNRDAIITTRFPSQSRLTQKEIREFDDLEELKKQLLLRNHNSFRHVEFKLLIPKQFNLDVRTIGGFIDVASFDGNIFARTNGGHISTQDLNGSVDLKTHGGSIVIGDSEETTVLVTHGGNIECGEITGGLTGTTHGGQIYISSLDAPSVLRTHGGEITIRKASSKVDALTHAGGIKINFVDQPAQDCRLETRAGNVWIGYTEDVAFDVEASCNKGVVSGPFVKKRTSKIKARLNDGGVGLTATSYVGSIHFDPIREDKIPLDMNPSRKNANQGRAAFDRAYNLHIDGRIDEAIVAHRKAAQYAAFRGIATYNLGCAWALKGDKKKAFDALNAAIDYGYDDVPQYKRDSDLDSLRNDPRFDKLMNRLTSDDESCDEDCDELHHEDHDQNNIQIHVSQQTGSSWSN